MVVALLIDRHFYTQLWKKKYWQSFAELNNTEDFQKRTQDEFKEELPFEDLNDKGWLDEKAPPQGLPEVSGF